MDSEQRLLRIYYQARFALPDSDVRKPVLILRMGVNDEHETWFEFTLGHFRARDTSLEEALRGIEIEIHDAIEKKLARLRAQGASS